MGTGLLITIGATAVGTAVVEKICISFGKSDMAQMVNIAGYSLVGLSAIGLTFQLFNKLKNLL